MHPTNLVQDWADFAASVVYEFKYNQTCLDSADASEDCFMVTSLSNGEVMALAECVTNENKDGTLCTYP